MGDFKLKHIFAGASAFALALYGFKQWYIDQNTFKPGLLETEYTGLETYMNTHHLNTDILSFVSAENTNNIQITIRDAAETMDIDTNDGAVKQSGAQALKKNDGTCAISINDSITDEGTMLIALGHEIGHCLDESILYKDSDPLRDVRIEATANYFSGRFLNHYNEDRQGFLDGHGVIMKAYAIDNETREYNTGLYHYAYVTGLLLPSPEQWEKAHNNVYNCLRSWGVLCASFEYEDIWTARLTWIYFNGDTYDSNVPNQDPGLAYLSPEGLDLLFQPYRLALQ